MKNNKNADFQAKIILIKYSEELSNKLVWRQINGNIPPLNNEASSPFEAYCTWLSPNFGEILEAES